MISLHNADKHVLQSLAKLREPSMSGVLKLVSGLMEEAKVALVATDDMVRVHRLQGRAQAFDDLLKAVDDAASAEGRK